MFRTDGLTQSARRSTLDCVDQPQITYTVSASELQSPNRSWSGLESCAWDYHRMIGANHAHWDSRSMPQSSGLDISPANSADVPLILSLINELAEYEGCATRRCHGSVDSQGAFGPTPRAEAVIARFDGESCGIYALFHNFSTFWEAGPVFGGSVRAPGISRPRNRQVTAELSGALAFESGLRAFSMAGFWTGTGRHAIFTNPSGAQADPRGSTTESPAMRCSLAHGRKS